MLADLGTIALVLGFFLLAYGSLKYGTDILRGTVGDQAIVAAVACQGLTGATLAACKKAQPKPKPTGITAARPRGITAARPSASTPKSRARSTGGGVGGPTAKALACKQKGGTWQAYANIGTGGTAFRCQMPIRPASIIDLVNDCTGKAAGSILERGQRFTGWQETQYERLVIDKARRACANKYGYPLPQTSFKLQSKPYNPYPPNSEYCKRIRSNVCRFDTSSAACRYCSTAIPT